MVKERSGVMAARNQKRVIAGKRGTKQSKVQKETKPRNGTKGVKRRTNRSTYPQKFRDEVVEMLVEVGDINEVAKLYDVPPRTLERWWKKSGSPSIREDASPIRKKSGPLASKATNKTKTKDATPSLAITDGEQYVNHENRKQKLAHLFAVLTAKMETEGTSMSSSALKATATAMAIVSDKLEQLNAKERNLPPAARKPGNSPAVMPDNVVAMLPKKASG